MLRVVMGPPKSRIRRGVLQTRKLFGFNRPSVSIVSALAVWAGFASHRRHNPEHRNYCSFAKASLRECLRNLRWEGDTPTRVSPSKRITYITVRYLFTVRVAASLVTPPALFLTTTVNCAPLSAVVVAGVVWVEAVAPAMFTPFFCH